MALNQTLLQNANLLVRMLILLLIDVNLKFPDNQ